MGTYPAVVGEKDEKIREDILKNLATNYLYKDIYMFESIRNPRVFEDLVRVLALQVGSMVSYNELSNLLGVTRVTVEKYIRLLEQAFVIKIVRSFSRNLRTEIRKAFKVFFYDNGIRNAVVDNLTKMELRGDTGQVFENFFVADRIKQLVYGAGTNVMFWRNRQGEEVDIVETLGEELHVFECRWGEGAYVRKPGQFLSAYPNVTYEVITPEIFLQ